MKTKSYLICACTVLLSLSSAKASPPWEFVLKSGGEISAEGHHPEGTHRATSFKFQGNRSSVCRFGPVFHLVDGARSYGPGTPIPLAELRLRAIEPSEVVFPVGDKRDLKPFLPWVSLREEVQNELQGLDLEAVRTDGMLFAAFRRKLSVSYALHMIPEDFQDGGPIDWRYEDTGQPDRRPTAARFVALSSSVQFTIGGEYLSPEDRPLLISPFPTELSIAVARSPKAIDQASAWWEMQPYGFDASFALVAILEFPDNAVEVVVNVFIPHREGDLPELREVCNFALRPFLVCSSVIKHLYTVEAGKISRSSIFAFVQNNEIATLQALLSGNLRVRDSIATAILHPKTFREAVAYGSSDMLKLLRDHGAGIDDEVPLQIAERTGDKEKAKLLVMPSIEEEEEEPESLPTRKKELQSGRVSPSSPPLEAEVEEEEEPEALSIPATTSQPEASSTPITIPQEEEEEEEEEASAAANGDSPSSSQTQLSESGQLTLEGSSVTGEASPEEAVPARPSSAEAEKINDDDDSK